MITRTLTMALFATILISSQIIQMTYAQEETKLFPSWFNQNLRWFLDGQLDEKTLAEGFKYLADNNIIFLDPDRAMKIKQLQDENKILKQRIGIDPKEPIQLRPAPSALPELPELPKNCPDVYSPVCGTDGQTYGNECKALLAEIGVAYLGVCEDSPDRQCRPGMIYDSESNLCVNAVCPKVLAPVCGTDGQTYDNRCFAQAAQIDIKHDGQCQRPDACPKIYAPVCGKNGQTYGNECIAEQNGIEVIYEGECLNRKQVQCPTGYFLIECAGICVKDNNDFICPEGYSWSDQKRQCFSEDMPTYCPAIYDPVCGTDGRTYGNECEAAKKQVPIDHAGECQNKCTSNQECDGEMVCREGICQTQCTIQCFQYDPVCGTDGKTYGCGIADAQCHGVEVAYEGECRKNSEPCTDEYSPVCGTDRVTYPNSCLALRAGVGVLHEGKCEVETPCPEIYDPVCGVDGNTYENSCFARAANVEIEHEGQCVRISSSPSK